jgi:hypothetical protein
MQEHYPEIQLSDLIQIVQQLIPKDSPKPVPKTRSFIWPNDKH